MITKPTVGATGWNTAVDAVIDQVNDWTGTGVGTGKAARIYATANPGAFADNTVVDLVLAGTDFTHAAFDLTATANRIRVLAAGLYMVACEVGLTGGTTGPRTGLIRKNGSTVREFGPGGDTARHSAAAVIPLAANDEISLAVYTIGGPELIASGSKDTGLTVAYLGTWT